MKIGTWPTPDGSRIYVSHHQNITLRWGGGKRLTTRGPGTHSVERTARRPRDDERWRRGRILPSSRGRQVRRGTEVRREAKEANLRHPGERARHTKQTPLPSCARHKWFHPWCRADVLQDCSSVHSFAPRRFHTLSSTCSQQYILATVILSAVFYVSSRTRRRTSPSCERLKR